ncbi:MAG: cupin domain-containing protein [Alicyclobacillus macrosporangiidus]|uniref:cupin domain-containing protein n=1 Tax=Alicyclobacillus macrosporangiidus TaxID=392015 RepID=UPI0026EB8A59|nr:cupin domain-containing protein [Alicyclobacillus macrosporangiidus]MCL6600106.1 cupin domain-containing protein [Alicyclobacillus macrosporangiidus]
MRESYVATSVEWDGKADDDPIFTQLEQLQGFAAAEGVKLHPLFTKNMTLSYATFTPGAVAPMHQHPEEQLSIVLQGRLVFEVGQRREEVGPGGVVAIPSNVPHQVTAGPEPCTVIDVFSPPREGFRILLAQAETPSER